MREKSGGPTYESHLYERWQESKKLREDLVEFCRHHVDLRQCTHIVQMLVDQAARIEEEAKAEYDAW